MKAFMVFAVCTLMGAASAGTIREKRGYLHDSHATSVSYSVPSLGYHSPILTYSEPAGIASYSAPAVAHSAPAAHVVAVNKVVNVHREVSVPQVVHVRKVISEPRLVTVKQVVPAAHDPHLEHSLLHAAAVASHEHSHTSGW